MPATAPAIERLKSLQDGFGALNDLGVLAATIADEAAELERTAIARLAEAEPVPERPRRVAERTGLAALAAALARARGERRHSLAAAWLDEPATDAAGLERELDAVLRELSG